MGVYKIYKNGQTESLYVFSSMGTNDVYQSHTDGVGGSVDIIQRERTTISCNYLSEGNSPQKNTGIRTLDNSGPRSFVKIYCGCGRIVDLDKKEMNIKKALKKELECIACRNARIAKDIDFLNAYYDGTLVAEDASSY